MSAHDFEKLVQDYIHDTNYATGTQATCNIIYAIINAGIVMLPYAADATGVGLFTFSVIAACVLSAYTSVILVKMACDHKVRHHEDLGELAFGSKGYYSAAFLQFFFSSLVMIITFSVFGDIVCDFISAMGVSNRSDWLFYFTKRPIVILTGAVLVLPRCLSSSTSHLWFNSVASCFSLLLVIITIVFVFFSESGLDYASNPLRVTPKWWVTPGIVLFSVSYQQKVFVMYDCMRKRSPSRWTYSVLRGHLVVAVSFTVFGCFGFMYHQRGRHDVDPDYFNSYPEQFSSNKKIIFDVARVAMAFSLLGTAPVDCLVSANMIRSTWYRFSRLKNAADSTASANNSRGEYSILGYSSESSEVDLLSDYLSPNRSTNDDHLSRQTCRNSDVSDTTRTSAATTLRNVVWTPAKHVAESNCGFPFTETSVSGEHTLSFNSYLENGHRASSSDVYDQIGKDYNRESSRLDSTREVDESDVKSPLEVFLHTLPTIFVWCLSLIFAINIYDWALCIATVGTISASLVVFILPSMLYFRLGVMSDFQAIPLLGFVIPNRLYMSVLQATGFILFIGNIIKTILIISDTRGTYS